MFRFGDAYRTMDRIVRQFKVLLVDFRGDCGLAVHTHDDAHALHCAINKVKYNKTNKSLSQSDLINYCLRKLIELRTG